MATDPTSLPLDQQQAILDQAAAIQKQRDDAAAAIVRDVDNAMKAALASDAFREVEQIFAATNAKKAGQDTDLAYAVLMFTRLRARYDVAA